MTLLFDAPDADAAKELEEVLKQVTDAARDEVATLTLANIYLKRHNYAQAIATLKKSATQSAVMHLAFGDVYRIQGSLDLAQKHYMSAIEQGVTTKDGQVVVAAKAGLAESLLLEANNDFAALKDDEKWDELKQKIAILNPDRPTNPGADEQLMFLSGCPVCPQSNPWGRMSGGICRPC